MSAGDLIAIEVACATPERQLIVKLDVVPGTTIRAAIEQSGILENFPQIDLAQAKVGIFSRLATLEEAPQAGDRIEIYRPLIADPKEVRRQRAAGKK